MARGVSTSSFQGIYYRVFNKGVKDPRLSKRGRFHEPNDGDTTYLAETTQTAVKEVKAHIGVGQFIAADWRITRVLVDLERVVDLRDRSIRKTLGVRKKELMEPKNLARSQRLGRSLRKTGVQGIVYESIRDRGRINIVVFLENVIEAHIRFGELTDLGTL